MKKFLMIALLAIASVGFAAAQPRAIGGNLGYSAGFSYQHGFGESNMLDIAVSVPFLDGFGIGGHVSYDWIDPFGATFDSVWSHKGMWHWCMGVGGAGGAYNFGYSWYGYAYGTPHWYAGVAGHFGVAYDFWFPLELSIDWRPTFGVDNHHWDAYGDDHLGFNVGGLYAGISLGVRYKF